MRKYVLVPIIVAALCIMVPATTFAHVLKTDGTIGAVLHVKPDDAPTSKTPITYELSFQDSKGDFSLHDCACSIAFIANGTTIATQKLEAKSAVVSQNTITFPTAAVYTFQVSGTPKNSATFNSFQLNFIVRVGGGQADKRGLPLLLWVGMAMGIGLLLLSTYASEYATNRQKMREDS